MVIRVRCLRVYNNIIVVIRIVEAVPVIIGAPRIVAEAAAHIHIVAVPVVGIIPVVEIAPAGAVMHFHTQVAVFIILIVLAGIAVILVPVLSYIVILRTNRGIIHIIGGLTGLVGGCTAGKYSSKECQK